VASTLFVQRNLEHRVGGVVTWGQPRIGDEPLAKLLDSAYPNNFLRFVHDNDIIPRFPLEIPYNMVLGKNVAPSLLDKVMLSTTLGLRGYHEPLGQCLFLNGGKVFDFGRGRCPEINILEVVAEYVLTPIKVHQLLMNKASLSGILARALMPDMILDHYPVGYLKILTGFLADEKAEVHQPNALQKIEQKVQSRPAANHCRWILTVFFLLSLLVAVVGVLFKFVF